MIKNGILKLPDWEMEYICFGNGKKILIMLPGSPTTGWPDVTERKIPTRLHGMSKPLWAEHQSVQFICHTKVAAAVYR